MKEEEKEIWKDIKGYEGLYQISNLGNVKSLCKNKERILIQNLCKGYLHVGLSKNGKSKTILVHRLVATAFIDNPNNLPVINHKDECKTNNCVDNLEWCDYRYNAIYGTCISRVLKTKKLRNCKTAERPVLQFTKDGKFVNEYHSTHEAKRCTGISQGNIVSSCRKRKGHTTAGGYIWKYKNNEECYGKK